MLRHILRIAAREIVPQLLAIDCWFVGTFWRPQPEDCPGSDPFISYVHGTADKTFPLTGRLIRGKWHQGDTRHAIGYFLGRHGPAAPVASRSDEGRLQCERTPTAEGGEIELCLHEGGHSVRTEWIERGWNRLAAFKGW
jgi:polyhydroxybutyrate depolymerase